MRLASRLLELVFPAILVGATALLGSFTVRANEIHFRAALVDVGQVQERLEVPEPGLHARREEGVVAVLVQGLLVVDRPRPLAPHRGLVDADVLVAERQASELDESRVHEQVVQRLNGLSAEELEAVRAYEESGRKRKTILARVQQLQSGS